VANQNVAIVTGAGRGLGREIAHLLSRKRFAIACADMGASAEDTAGLIGEAGGRALALQVDVRDAASIDAAFTETVASIGLPSVLINNAGIYPDNTLLDMPEDAWDAVLDTNLKGTFLCAQRFARLCVGARKCGSIVNLASTAAFSSRIGAAHYTASKAGVVALTRSMAQEWGPHGIRVNAVAPGPALTEGAVEFIMAGAPAGIDVDAQWGAYEARIPLRRLAHPDDVARAALFLASELGAYVNGAQIVVDGGLLTA
jgi:NAD(P)-dependent dehydrogenase (short-subunit alcohol dehydrogenase family)